MTQIDPPRFVFCPFCARPLDTRDDEGRLRQYCHYCDWIHYPRVASSVVAVAVQKRDLLLVKKANEPFKGTWILPSGFVEFGEHPRDALIREMQEETGLRPERTVLVDVLQSEDDPREPGHLMYFYDVRVAQGKIGPTTDEIEEAAWVGLDETVIIGCKQHREVVECVRSGRWRRLQPGG